MLDGSEGDRLRDEALKRVEENAHNEWKKAAIAALEQVCRENEYFTSDDLAEKMGDNRPREPRAFGAMILYAPRNGWAEATGRHIRSAQPSTHRSPRTVWRSLLYQGPTGQPVLEGKVPSPATSLTSGKDGSSAGLTVEMIDAITVEQWDEITDGKGAAMKGFLRKRMKRAIRLLTEGRIYDDPTEDGRTLAARAGKG